MLNSFNRNYINSINDRTSSYSGQEFLSSTRIVSPSFSHSEVGGGPTSSLPPLNGRKQHLNIKSYDGTKQIFLKKTTKQNDTHADKGAPNFPTFPVLWEWFQ